MKVKVTKKFKDKYTGKTYEVGQELDLTADRVKEIKAVGNFIDELPVRAETTAKKTTAKKSKKDEPAED